MSFYELMRLAENGGQAVTLDDTSHLTHNPQQNTGMDIFGEFQSFKRGDGRTVYIGQDGQYMIK